jgi:glycosyltransferase involved in cell wall biosynthesis
MKSKRCNKPLVSIGMPIYNGERYVREALDSLLAQDYENFELIISDNASTDSTFKICKEYARRDKRIQLYRNETNIGVANANRVFELSSADYFMWASHDDVWAKTYIRKCVKKLEEYPTAVLCCSEIKFISEDGSELTEWHYNNLQTLGMTIPQRVHELISRWNWYAIYGLILKEALDKVTLSSDKFGTDVILLLELVLQGEFAKVHEPQFYYQISPYGINLPLALNVTQEKVKSVCEILEEILREQVGIYPS